MLYYTLTFLLAYPLWRLQQRPCWSGINQYSCRKCHTGACRHRVAPACCRLVYEYVLEYFHPNGSSCVEPSQTNGHSNMMMVLGCGERIQKLCTLCASVDCLCRCNNVTTVHLHRLRIRNSGMRGWCGCGPQLAHAIEGECDRGECAGAHAHTNRD